MDIAEEALAQHAAWKGKLAFDPKMDIATRHDLAVAYTPGVAEPCKVIAENPEAAYDYTLKGNPVAVVTEALTDYPQKVALSTSLGFGGHNAALAFSPYKG